MPLGQMRYKRTVPSLLQSAQRSPDECSLQSNGTNNESTQKHILLITLSLVLTASIAFNDCKNNAYTPEHTPNVQPAISPLMFNVADQTTADIATEYAIDT